MGKGGIQACQAARGKSHYPLLVMTAGADSYLLKDCGREELSRALREVGQRIPLNRGLPHLGQSGGTTRGSELRPRITNKITLFAATYAPLRKQEVECHPPEFSYSRKHTHQPQPKALQLATDYFSGSEWYAELRS